MKTRRTRKLSYPPPVLAEVGSSPVDPSANTPVSDGRERVPPQWAWHHNALVRLRERLRPRLPAGNDQLAHAEIFGPQPDAAEIERLWIQLTRETDPLFEVDCALQRIRDGVYEFCEETGRTIPPERLRSIPWTRYFRSVADPPTDHPDAPSDA